MGAKFSCRTHKVGKDPDEVWSNLYREKEKNNMYRWVGSREGGDLVSIYETQGEDGVLAFAEEKLTPMFHDEGAKDIQYNDYVKWKKQMSLELGLDEVNLTEWESRFVEHKALWRLNKRGVDGENIVHLLLSRDDEVCHEIARILLKAYPGLAGDVYLSDEYFGQSALHLAIVNDDYETAELLLQSGASVNTRACGDFFIPEDWKTRRKLVDYTGFAYYGEYPLAFAACFGNKDIYDLLLDHGADPNMKDSFGNTILHMCVISNSISMYSYAVQHWLVEADPNITNTAGHTPLTLAARLGRKKIFDEMLELSKVEFWRFYNMACSAYPMKAVDTIQDDGTTDYDSAVMTVINGKTEEHLDMIGSEVIQRLMADKWEAFAKIGLFKRMALLVLHCIFISVAAGLRPTELDRLYFNLSIKLNQSEIDKYNADGKWLPGPRPDDWCRLVCEIFSFALALIFYYQQGTEVKAQGIRAYLKNMQATPAKAIYSVSCFLIILCLPLRLLRFYEFEEIFIVLIVPGTYSYWLFFCRTFKLTGPFVQMIYSMVIGDLFKFVLIASIFLVPFSIVFTFLGQDIPQKQKIPTIGKGEQYKCAIQGYVIFTYQDTFETLISLFRASLGGYDYEELQCTNYELFTKILFVLYMLCMPVMMINILIAMMGNTYTTVIERAEKAWRQQYAQIIMNLERSVDPRALVLHMLNYSINLDENGDARGLMVVKMTRTSKRQERRQALKNWKNIGHKVVKIVSKLGVESSKKLLHGYAHIEKLFEEAKERRPPTRAQWPSLWRDEGALADESHKEGAHLELVPSYSFLKPPTPLLPKSVVTSPSPNVNILTLDVQQLPATTVPMAPPHLVGNSQEQTERVFWVRPGHVHFHEHFSTPGAPNMPTIQPPTSKGPRHL